MTAALYFGSFNPMHAGHLSICRYLASLYEIAQVRVIVSPANPVKDLSVVDNAAERLYNAKSIIAKQSGEVWEKVLVSDIEFHMCPPLYTINTLEKLSGLEPETRFILVMGADNIAIMDRWYRWRDILAGYEVWIYPRYGYDGNKLACKYPEYNVRFLADAPLINISSTEIRNAGKE